MANHRINKVLLDFSFTNKEKETALVKAKQLFYEQAIPPLEAGFDKIDKPMYIDKLEIDLGITTSENFGRDFLNAFTKRFETIKSSQKVNAVTNSNEDHFRINDLLFFLEKGYWPWNYQQKSEREIQLLIRSFFETESQMIDLFQRLRTQPQFAERLIHLAFSGIAVRNLFIHGLEKYHPFLVSVLPLLPKDWKTNVLNPESFYYSFLREILLSQPIQDVEQIFVLVRKIIKQPHPAFDINAVQKLKQPTPGNNKKNLELLKTFFLHIENKSSSAVIIPGLSYENAEKNISSIINHAEEKDAEKIHISNAGLVLLHPYLLPVFRDLNWIDIDKKFVNRKSQQKAVLFLQYLVNGKSRQAEHLLVLNKLLCNWPVNFPVPASSKFSKREKNAAGDLLESLREHWTVMKNTSNRGLVESFVNRAGLVQKTAAGYLLQVEKKTIDILMDTLPFGINIIKLPWNENLIYTEW